ncbi:hypothetical protein OG599_29170 [Streptomyces sp. NBC_01335]|uniref:hypothetical protein n=1 Tax=Streptomyces sp. NBC_01335 TaxID=2903828 RepID=UPI002E166873|nr:hypothetical protein OG599_29170 [Streptomyces sp. NBC_01335]
MSAARPFRTSISPLRGPRGRVARVAALTAGATLGLGVLSMPLAAASDDPGATGTVASAADEASAPAVTLGSASVKAGGSVSFTATGFPADSKVSVKLDDAALLAQFTSGADGSVTGTVTIPSDTTPGTTHWLRLLAPQTSLKSAALTVTAATTTPEPATPRIQLGTTKVTAGGTVSFALSGFVEGQDVTVKLDDQTILKQWTAAVKADGTFAGTVTVPATAAEGAHWLRVLAPEPSTSLRADFTVTSSSSTGGSSSGSSGSSGSGSSGSGGGSTSGSTTGGSTGGSSGGTSTGDSGTGTGGTSTGNSSTGGTATSATSATITAGSSVAAGGKVSFRLTGYPAGQQITVKFDDDEIIGQWPDGIAADGTFSGTVTVPATATKGAHWLRFLAPNPSTSTKADFTVTSGADTSATTSGAGGTSAATGTNSASADGSAAVVPAATGAPASAVNASGAKAEITASEVQPGGKLHFKVAHFPASQVVTIKLDDDAILGQWDIDAEGSFEGDVDIPAEVTPGAHWLRFLAPSPSTTLKVDFTVLAADSTAAASSSSSPSSSDATTATTDATVNAASVRSAEAGVSYATIAWAAGAAAVGGAAGAAGATTFILRRRKPQQPEGV